MDESQKKYLSDTENYNDTILNDEMDVVREKIFNSLSHINSEKWLTVSFTNDKKWAI